MFKNKKVLLIAGLIVLAGGIYGYYKVDAQEGGLKPAAEGSIENYTVESMTIGESLETTGRLRAENSRLLISKGSSDFINLNVEIGDRVKEGEIIGSLDESSIELEILNKEKEILELESNLDALKSEGSLSYKNSYENAKSDYESKKQNYENNIALYDASSISKQELDASKIEVDRAYKTYQEAESKFEAYDLDSQIKILNTSLKIKKMDLEALKRDLEETIIKAPFDSVVTDIFVSSDDLIREGTELMELMDDSSLIVDLQVSEYEEYKIKEGQNVSISPYGDKDKTYRGIVDKLYPSGSTDDDQSYVRVEVRLLDTDERLKPGFSVTLSIEISNKENAMVVPYDALVKTNKGYFLNKINEDGSSQRLIVDTGIESDLYIEIISDEIKVGDRVSKAPESSSPKNNDESRPATSIMAPAGNPGGGRGGK